MKKKKHISRYNKLHMQHSSPLFRIDFFKDPKVCGWMLQPDDPEKNLPNMVMSYAPELAGIISHSCLRRTLILV